WVFTKSGYEKREEQPSLLSFGFHKDLYAVSAASFSVVSSLPSFFMQSINARAALETYRLLR
ncbi:MAG: hypothetical protein V8S69_02475, partial [Dakarella massiliensis]